MDEDKSRWFAIIFYGILTLIAGTFIFLFEMEYLTAPNLTETYKLGVSEAELIFDTVKCPDGTAQPCTTS